MSRIGAEFRKADFQIHSPRDAGWDGNRPEDPIAEPADAAAIQLARQQWSKEFIDKCLAEGLRAVAITDHHEGVYVFEVINWLNDQKSKGTDLDIWVFPGMEITLKDSCQALIIFDADLPQSLFETARLKLDLPTDVKPLEKVGIRVDLIKKNLEEIQDLLGSSRELEDRFIILPHVKPEGHKTVLRKGFHIRFKDMPYVGGYMDRKYLHELNHGDKAILLGEIPAWSSERRGVISTSDSRYADFRLIGKHASWVKLAAPTAESIRQAMLAADSRLKDQEPRFPKVVIERVRVKGSAYLHPDEFEFNQQLNVIIGGRGAGKSTLLEYIRFAMGCSAIDEKDLSDPSITRMKNLLESTLSNSEGEVTVFILLNGASVKLTRSMKLKTAIQVEQGGSIVQISPSEVTDFIPVQSFRQGELSELAGDQTAQRLLDLVTADEREGIRRIESELKNIGGDISTQLGNAMRFASANGRIGALGAEKTLVLSQIESLKQQITPGDPSTQSVINNHSKFESENTKLQFVQDQIKSSIEDIKYKLNSLNKAVSSMLEDSPSIEIPELNNFYSTIRSLLSDRTDDKPGGPLYLLNISLLDADTRTAQQLTEAAVKWKTVFDAHQLEYNKQTALLVGQEEKLTELARLTARSQQISKDLEAANQELLTCKDAEFKVDALRRRHLALQKELDDVVGQQALRIENASAGLARGQLSLKKRYENLKNTIYSILNISHLREVRIESCIQEVTTSDDPRSAWDSIIHELYSLLLWKERSPEGHGDRPVTQIMMKCLDETFLDRLIVKLKVDDVANAMQVILHPVVDIFQKRGASEVEFKLASQGEQAATLLNILMNQAVGPLLVDQPEADLDNRIINDVIKTISKTKNERQLILATHSANITVNADSELVIELDIGQKRSIGAIDEISVRSAITDTLEGGKEAFELRRKKYNF